MLKRLIQPLVPHRLWTQLRLMRLRAHVKNYKPKRISHTYGPFRLEIEVTDGMSEAWYDKDQPEAAEFRLMTRYHRVGSGARIFDLGAHQGVVAVLMSRYVGPEGEVIALEANGHNAAAARRNAELNGAANCKVLHAAVAEHTGKLVFNEGLNGSVDDGSGDWGRVEVDAYSIDDLAARFGRPDILFIDVEGYECHALAGAPKTLATRPDVFVEVHLGAGLEKFSGSVEKVLSFFPRSVYTLYFNEEDGPEFRTFDRVEELPKHRFFLFAIANR